ncbi:MAG: hypothetical protein WC806_00695 [Candidatus Gracilibacteria bacterium]|jgi:hypothetical protein
MANNKPAKLEIGDAQIELLYNPQEPEKIEWTKAENIIGKTEAEVNAVLKGHKELFESAKENIKESLPEGDDRDRRAFVLAFNRVYGQFKIENAKLSVYDEDSLKSKLDGVLVKKVDIAKLKERPELYAAYLRLAELENAENIDPTEIERRITKCQDEIDALQNRENDHNAAEGIFEEIDKLKENISDRSIRGVEKMGGILKTNVTLLKETEAHKEHLRNINDNYPNIVDRFLSLSSGGNYFLINHSSNSRQINLLSNKSIVSSNNRIELIDHCLGLKHDINNEKIASKFEKAILALPKKYPIFKNISIEENERRRKDFDAIKVIVDEFKNKRDGRLARIRSTSWNKALTLGYSNPALDKINAEHKRRSNKKDYNIYKNIAEQIIANHTNSFLENINYSIKYSFLRDYNILQSFIDGNARLSALPRDSEEFFDELTKLPQFQSFKKNAESFVKEFKKNVPRTYNAGDEKEKLESQIAALKKIKEKPTASIDEVLNDAFKATSSEKDFLEKEDKIKTLKKSLETYEKVKEYIESHAFGGAESKLNFFKSDSLFEPDANFSKTLLDSGIKKTDILEIPLGIAISGIEMRLKNTQPSKEDSPILDINGKSIKREDNTQKNSQLNTYKLMLQSYWNKSKTLHKELLKLSDILFLLIKSNHIQLNDNEKKAISALHSLDINDDSFSLKTLIDHAKIIIESTNIKNALEGLEKDDSYFTNIANSKQELEKAEHDLSKMKSEKKETSKLSDSQAAKKLYLSIIKKLYPDMKEDEQKKMAAMNLTEDLAKLENAKSYEQLATEGSVELKDALDEALFATLLKYQFKTGGKVIYPFKGFDSLDDLDDWSKVEKQFSVTGKFDMDTGFAFLAGIEKAGKKLSGTKTSASLNSIVYIKLEQKLKEMIAKDLGVSTRMDETEIRKIVNIAFADQLKGSKEFLDGFFTYFNKDKGKRDEKMIKALNYRRDILKHRKSLGEIDSDEFREEYDKIVEDAKQAGVLKELGFMESAFFSKFFKHSKYSGIKDKANDALIGASSAFNSKTSAWMGDKVRDAGRHVGKKAGAVVTGTLLTGLKGIWGGAGLIARAGIATVESAKYPLLLIFGKPLIGTYNKITKGKWDTPSIKTMIGNDARRVLGYSKTKAVGTWGATKESYSSTWKNNKWEKIPYEKRAKIKRDEIEKKIKSLTEKGTLEPMEITAAPAFDKDKYKKMIETLDAKNNEAQAKTA